VGLLPWGEKRSEAWIPEAANLRNFAVDAALRARASPACCRTRPKPRPRLEGTGDLPPRPARCDGVARLYQSRGYLRHEAEDLDHRPEVYLEAYPCGFGLFASGARRPLRKQRGVGNFTQVR